MPKHHDKPLAAVIGAGVVGLTTALLMQSNGYGTFVRFDIFSGEQASRLFCGQAGLIIAFIIILIDVTVIAADFPRDPKSPDYASTKAGAHWRSMCDEDDLRCQGKALIFFSGSKYF